MLIPVKDRKKLEENGIYFSPTTLRKWHSLGVNAQIFAKINGRLFINLDAWQALIAQKSKESEIRAKRLEEFRG